VPEITTASFQLRAHSACCPICDVPYAKFVVWVKRPRAWNWRHNSIWRRNQEWEKQYLQEVGASLPKYAGSHPRRWLWCLEPEVSQASVGVCVCLSRINWDQVWRNKPKVYKIAERVFFKASSLLSQQCGQERDYAFESLITRRRLDSNLVHGLYILKLSWRIQNSFKIWNCIDTSITLTCKISDYILQLIQSIGYRDYMFRLVMSQFKVNSRHFLKCIFFTVF